MPTSLPYGSIGGLAIVGITIDPASVAAGTTAEQTFTVPGLRLTDLIVSVTKPTLTAGVGIVNARVSAANTLAISFANATAAPVDAGPELYKVLVARPEGSGTGYMTRLSF